MRPPPPPVKNIIHELSDTLSLAECRDGFWLWDETRGMNLSMRAKTEREAFTEALTYYQGRLQEREAALKSIHEKVGSFVNSVHSCEANDE